MPFAALAPSLDDASFDVNSEDEEEEESEESVETVAVVAPVAAAAVDDETESVVPVLLLVMPSLKLCALRIESECCCCNCAACACAWVCWVGTPAAPRAADIAETVGGDVL